MAELFECSSENILLHLQNVYKNSALEEDKTTKFFLVVQIDGNRSINRKILFYNLDAIMAVVYRVNSKKGTQFRKWATATYFIPCMLGE